MVIFQFSIKAEKVVDFQFVESDKCIALMERAKKYYEELSYVKGIKLYQKALNICSNNNEILYELAFGYFHANEIEKAYITYSQVIGETTTYYEHYLIYAEILSGKKDYEEARKWYQFYEKKHGQDHRVKDRIKGQEEEVLFYQNSSRFNIAHLTFNSETYDFSPAFYHDKIVFVSGRNIEGVTQFLKPKYQRDNTNFLNLLVVDSTGQVKPFDKRINTSYHEGPICFFDNNKKMIYTRNNFIDANENSGKANKLKLYYAEESSNGVWSKPVDLWFNGEDFSTGHPTVTEDGQKLYFSSDRPGGNGKSDIYVSEWQVDNWGEPKNLGSIVNTEGSELFPFIDKNNVLYYASDGLPGIGGLDIFRINLNEPNPWPQNMGHPLNSTRDDFGIILKESDSQLSGYFSSNRGGGEGLDDIYSFTFETEIQINGVVKDASSKKGISNAEVTIENRFKNSSQTASTKNKGEFSFKGHLDDIYSIIIEHNLYLSDLIILDPMEITGHDTLSINLTKKEISVSGNIIDESGQKVEGVYITILNDNFANEEVKYQSNSLGFFTLKVQPFDTYFLKIEKDGYISQHEIITTEKNSIDGISIEIKLLE